MHVCAARTLRRWACNRIPRIRVPVSHVYGFRRATVSHVYAFRRIPQWDPECRCAPHERARALKTSARTCPHTQTPARTCPHTQIPARPDLRACVRRAPRRGRHQPFYRVRKKPTGPLRKSRDGPGVPDTFPHTVRQAARATPNHTTLRACAQACVRACDGACVRACTRAFAAALYYVFRTRSPWRCRERLFQTPCCSDPISSSLITASCVT